MKDIVDIIMPAYNCEKYIKDAIESVKSQTISKWRLIIINDFSNDNTQKEIESSIKGIEDKVKLIQVSQNMGVANARNLGLDSSENRYIAFLDADDVWEEHKLEKQLKYMRENDYEFTYTSYTYARENKDKKVRYFPKQLNYKQALRNTFILTSTVMIDTCKIPKEYIKMPSIPSEDTKTWWNILKQGKTAYGLEENLTMYRVTKNGLSSNKFRNLGRTWNLYRKYEKLNLFHSIYCFFNYFSRAIIKRIV